MEVQDVKSAIISKRLRSDPLGIKARKVLRGVFTELESGGGGSEVGDG
jgi:hypothetical protein